MELKDKRKEKKIKGELHQVIACICGEFENLGQA